MNVNQPVNSSSLATPSSSSSISDDAVPSAFSAAATTQSPTSSCSSSSSSSSSSLFPSAIVLICVASGGIAGTITRYSIEKQLSNYNALFITSSSSSSSSAVPNIVDVDRRFPVSTLTVNLFGSAFIGLLHVALTHFQKPQKCKSLSFRLSLLRAFAVTGFCGSLTTMSSYALDFVTLVSHTSLVFSNSTSSAPSSSTNDIDPSIIYRHDSTTSRAGLAVAYLITTNVGCIILTWIFMILTSKFVKTYMPHGFEENRLSVEAITAASEAEITADDSIDPTIELETVASSNEKEALESKVIDQIITGQMDLNALSERSNEAIVVTENGYNIDISSIVDVK